MCLSSIVLPALGGLTMRARWPLPIGLTRLTRRWLRFLGSLSRLMSSSGWTGVRSPKTGRRRAVSMAPPVHDAVALVDDVEDPRRVGMAGTLGLGLEDPVDEVVLAIVRPGVHLQVAADLAELGDAHLAEVGDVEVVALAGCLELGHLLEFAHRRAADGIATTRASVAGSLVRTGHRKGVPARARRGSDRPGRGAPRR